MSRGIPTLGRVKPHLDIVWPITPFLWFSAEDINGTFNAGTADGASITTWKNKGSAGSGWNMTQSTGATKPLYTKVAAAPKMNNHSCVRGNASQYMSSSVVALQAQPVTWVVVGMTTSAGAQVWYSGSSTNRDQFLTTSYSVSLYAGGSQFTGQSVVASTYHNMTTLFSGAATVGSKDGTSAGAISCGTSGFDQVMVFTGPPPPSALMAGDILQLAAFVGTQPTAAQIQTAVTNFYGATPQ